MPISQWRTLYTLVPTTHRIECMLDTSVDVGRRLVIPIIAIAGCWLTFLKDEWFLLPFPLSQATPVKTSGFRWHRFLTNAAALEVNLVGVGARVVGCHVLRWLECLSLPFSNYHRMTKWIFPTLGSSSTMQKSIIMNRRSSKNVGTNRWSVPLIDCGGNPSFGGWGMLKGFVPLFFHVSHSKMMHIYMCVCHCINYKDKIGWPMMMSRQST